MVHPATFIIVAILELHHGHVEESVTKKGRCYQKYDTSINGSEYPNPSPRPGEPSTLRDSFPSELRVYIRSKDETIHIDGTIAIIVAKAHFPSNGVSFLEAMFVFPFPGDPTSPDYETRIPDFIIPIAFVIGTVLNAAQQLSQSSTARFFNMLTSEYVRDGIKESRVRYV